ncbi:hypothetical protein PG997_005698 [Apiospora hydei]|uniref:Uncharacterized protein n=1 Tax=Apiospora hydei TaxID=1337664 RepID=A0ABR1WN34_9PEZI
MVHTLKVPTAPAGVAVEEYQNLVASVIMACPNFEQLVGPIVTYDHTWNRLHHALSTRWKLREMNWVVGPSPYQRQRRIRSNSTAARMMAQSHNPQQLHAPPAICSRSRAWPFSTSTPTGAASRRCPSTACRAPL